MNENKSANYTGFSLVSGGLIYSITSILRGKSGSKTGLIRTALALIMITWVPVLVLSIISGSISNDTTETISFYEDFLFHVRFLLVVPFLILIENLVDRSFIGYVQNSDRIIDNSQQPAFNTLVKQLDKLTDSYIPELIVLLVTYLIIFINWNTFWVFDSGRNYLAYTGTTKLNTAGWYYILVCSPIFGLLVFRWLWRWLVWVYSIYRISRFKLRVDPLSALFLLPLLHYSLH